MRTRRVAVVAVCVVSALTAYGGPPGGTRSPDAAPVGPRTPPEDVVRSYLGALQADDEDAAAAVSTPAFAERDVWADDPPRIEDVQVATAQPEPTTGTAGEGWAQAVRVPVTFTVHGADVTVPDGPLSWSYVLVRDGDGEPWRVADAGAV